MVIRGQPFGHNLNCLVIRIRWIHLVALLISRKCEESLKIGVVDEGQNVCGWGKLRKGDLKSHQSAGALSNFNSFGDLVGNNSRKLKSAIHNVEAHEHHLDCFHNPKKLRKFK
ncbi:hypothetical protein TRVL_03496 [Trypanosoma vivax]|nr:hypothetical protein TRVL_03496 [Trypanosoma vivax]